MTAESKRRSLQHSSIESQLREELTTERGRVEELERDETELKKKLAVINDENILNMSGKDREIRQLRLDVAALKDTLSLEKERHDAALTRNEKLVQQVN